MWTIGWGMMLALTVEEVSIVEAVFKAVNHDGALEKEGGRDQSENLY